MTHPTPQLSAENMLRAVIEAQVRGGCNVHKPAVSRINSVTGDRVWIRNQLVASGETATHVLELLLEPEGLRAAYPGDMAMAPGMPYSKHIAYRILDAWLDGSSEAAIRTAFEFLPAATR